MRKCPRDQHLQRGGGGSGGAGGRHRALEQPRDRLGWPHGGSGAEAVLQCGSELGQHGWAFISPSISLRLWAALGLAAEGIPEGLKAAAVASPGCVGLGEQVLLQGDLRPSHGTYALFKDGDIE